MPYFTTLLDNNGKLAVYTGGNINGLYNYLEMIGSPTTLTNPAQRSHHFGTLSSTNNDTATLQPVIVDLCIRYNIICECFGRIGNMADACIIRGPKIFPPSLRRNMNQLNDCHGNEPTEPPRDWNR